MMSGAVRDKLQPVINAPTTDFSSLPKNELQAVHTAFANLVDRRNALKFIDDADDAAVRASIAFDKVRHLPS